MAEDKLPVMNDVVSIDMETLCRNSIELIRYSRSIVVQHINTVETMTYFVLGKWIIEEQQQGKDRA